MNGMTWNQRFNGPGPIDGHPAKVAVTVTVEGWSDETTRQLSVFIADLIRKGVRLSGHDDDNGDRVLTMVEATNV